MSGQAVYLVYDIGDVEVLRDIYGSARRALKMCGVKDPAELEAKGKVLTAGRGSVLVDMTSSGGIRIQRRNLK